MTIKKTRSRTLCIMNEAMLIAIQDNTEQLARELARFDYGSFNQRTASKWSAGQIAEHLLLFDLQMNVLLCSESIWTGRDPQEKISDFQPFLADAKNLLKAPDLLLPSDTIKEPGAIIDKIIIERKKLMHLIKEMDINKLIPNKPHRLYGDMTGTEWIQFLIFHTNRHVDQLKQL